jgi:hexulose-6-phosphate isomerase
MTKMLGMMQGRLTPPVDERIQSFPLGSWEQEFPKAAASGVDAIEWIYDSSSAGVNPIEILEGISKIRALSAEHRVYVRSLCADYFMDFPFVRATDADRAKSISRLTVLLGNARRAGVRRIVLPFVDSSAIYDASDRDAVVDSLARMLPAARAAEIELHLETSLAPDEFAALLARIRDPLVKVNYDSGNSASLGYRPAEEFAAYGDRIGSVHVKDRLLGGGTVPLGKGDADLDAVFRGLRRLNFGGDLVLQAARGQAGDEIAWARRNREFVARYLD